jgi:hypothetical protein
MQMIDVMKRLAELDSTNPNVVKESAVAECGPMGIMGGMESMEDNKPDTPASINMTAGSGDELANMLATIMQLAGVKQVGADDLGVEHDPAVVTAEPAMGVGPAVGDRDDMRSVLDKLNPMDGDEEGDQDSEEGDDESDDEEETDEGEYDNSPASAEPQQPFNANQFANQENQPGAGDSESGKPRNRFQPTATYEGLMAEYKAYIGE